MPSRFFRLAKAGSCSATIGTVCCPEPSATIRGSFLIGVNTAMLLAYQSTLSQAAMRMSLHHGSVKPITESAISSGQTTPVQFSSCATIVSLTLIQSFWEMEIEKFG